MGRGPLLDGLLLGQALTKSSTAFGGRHSIRLLAKCALAAILFILLMIDFATAQAAPDQQSSKSEYRPTHPVKHQRVKHQRVYHPRVYHPRVYHPPVYYPPVYYPPVYYPRPHPPPGVTLTRPRIYS